MTPPTPSEELALKWLTRELSYREHQEQEAASYGACPSDTDAIPALNAAIDCLRAGPPEGMILVTPRLWQALLDTRRLAGDENIAATWAERGPWAAWYYGVDEGQIVRQEMDILLAAASSGGKDG